VSNVLISLPATLTSPEPPATVECEGGTVSEALRDLAARTPRYGQRVFYNDRLLVSVVLNGAHLSPIVAQGTELHDGDHLELVTPVAGG
jgi:molybdopterin converting factor small subunit